MMAGTMAGGKKCAATNKQKYGEDFYRAIGSKGGKKGTTGGFYADHELASRAGRLGGMTSRRRKVEFIPVDDADIERSAMESAQW